MTGAFKRQQLNKRYRHFNAELADVIAELSIMKTVSDFGAGIGLYVDYLRSVGCYAIGYDGTEQTSDHVEVVNLAEPCKLPITQVVMSIEVGEHLPQEFESTFIDNLCNHATELIVLSWAIRGQRGRNHVNCRDPDELVPLFRAREWYVQHGETFDVRACLSHPFSRKLLLFRKTKDGYDDDSSIAKAFQMKFWRD